MTSQYARAAMRGGFVTVGSQGLALILRMFGLVVLARLIDPTVFGLAAIVNTVALFAMNIINMGLVAASSQYPGLTQRAKSSLFLINLSLGLMAGGAIFLLAHPISEAYGHPVLADMFQWIALVPVISGIQGQFRAQLMTELKFGGLSIADIVAQVVSTAVAIALAVVGLPIHGLVGQALAQPAALLVMIVVLSRWLPSNPGDWRTQVLDVVRVGSHVFGMNFARNLGRSALLPLMGLTVSAAALGAFDRAQQFAIMPVQKVVDQLQRVAVPVLGRLRDERERLIAYYAQAQAIIAYGTGWAFAVLAGMSSVAVGVVFGPGWEEAGVVLGILAIGSAFRAVGSSAQWLFIATGTTSRGALSAAILQPIIVVISLAGLPWGIVGVAVANTVAWILHWPVITLIGARAAKVPLAPLLLPSVRAFFLFSLVPGVCSFLLTFFLEAHDVIEVALAVVASVVSTLLPLVVPSVRADLRGMRDILRGGRRGPKR